MGSHSSAAQPAGTVHGDSLPPCREKREKAAHRDLPRTGKHPRKIRTRWHRQGRTPQRYPRPWGHPRPAGGQRLRYRGRRGEVPLRTCSALSGRPDPLLMSPAVLSLPWAVSPLPHSLPAVDCEGNAIPRRKREHPELPSSQPCHRLEGVRVPCGEPSSKTVLSLQPRPSGDHPQERDGPRGARHSHSEQQQAPGASFGAPLTHGSLSGLPPPGQVPRSQVWSKSNRTFSRSSPSSRLRSPCSPGRIPGPLATAAGPEGPPGHAAVPPGGSGLRGQRGAERGTSGRRGPAARGSPIPAASPGGAERRRKRGAGARRDRNGGNLCRVRSPARRHRGG